MKIKDHIARYLHHDMDAAERAGFEEQLAQDTFLAEGLDGLQQWQAETRQPFESLDAELARQVDNLLPAPGPCETKRKPKNNYILAAACFLGLLLTAYRFWASPGLERWSAQYFQPLSTPGMAQRGGVDSSQTNYAVKAYETENYKQAIYHYRQLLDKTPGDEKYRLFLGIAYLANYQPEKAVETLSATFTGRTEFEDDRQWYLALAYLRLSHVAAAKAILNELASGRSYYRDQAMELSKKMD